MSFRSGLFSTACLINGTTPRTVALGLFAAVSLSSALASAGIRKGPHLQDIRKHGVTVVWQQENAGAGDVIIDGARYSSVQTSGPYREVILDSLEPNTTYTYTLEADGAEESGTFTTAPSDPLQGFSFLVMGDNRSDHVTHAKVIDALLQEQGISFLVNTGDMVSSGEIDDDWQKFFEIELPLIKNLPWYPTVGNHEENDDAVPAHYTNYFAPPTDSSQSEAYYSFTYANSAFIVLDGHVNVDSQLFDLWADFNGAQKGWLNAKLNEYAAAPEIQHIFVFNHEPPYSSKESRDGNHAVRLLMPSLLAAGVDAFLSGHDHYLEAGTAPNGVRYYVTAGGGAPLYANLSVGNLGDKSAKALPWFDDAHTVNFARSQNGYVRIDIENGQVDLVFKDMDGGTLHEDGWNTGDLEPPPSTGGTGGEPGQPGGSAGTTGSGGAGAVGGEPAAGGSDGGAPPASGGSASGGDGNGPGDGSGIGDPGAQADEGEWDTENATGCGCRVAGPGTKPSDNVPIFLVGLLGLGLGLLRRGSR